MGGEWDQGIKTTNNVYLNKMRDLDDEGFVGRLRKEKTDLRTLKKERTYCGAPK